jgi:sugar/nucleoside kinase (ribokinase family)
VACQTWGLRTRYVGKLGDDDAARLHKEAFRRVGAEAQIVTVPGGASLHNVILIDAAGERTVICQRNDKMVLQPSDLRREWIVNARVLHVDGHDTAAATQAASWARAAGIPVVADLDDTYPGIEELVANIDYLIVSEDFSCRLMEEPNLERSAKTACWPGTASSCSTAPPIACPWSTLPAPATSFAPDSFTACCATGRSTANSISPAPPPP